MKKFFLFVVSSFAFILAGCGQSIADQDIAQRLLVSEKPVITWGTKADQNLFGQYHIEKRQIEGFDVDIAKEITHRVTNGKGEAIIIEATSKTRIPLLKNGNIDVIAATLTINASRAEQVDFSKVYFNAGQTLLVHEDSKVNSIDDLGSDDIVLGVKGANSTQNFRDLKPGVQVHELENYSEAFVALQAEQGNALTGDNTMALGLIEQSEGFRLAGPNLTAEPYGLAVNKNQDDFLALINQALADMIADGTYNKIYDNWFGDLMAKENPAAELAVLDQFVEENIYGDGDATLVDPELLKQAIEEEEKF